MKQAQKVFRFLTALVCFSAIPLQATNSKNDIDKIGHRRVARWNIIPQGMETRMGRLAAARLDGSARFVQNKELSEYVSRIATKVAANSDFKTPVTVKIIDSPFFNASSLPGGFLYLTTGLLKNLDNEAQLAAALSHEIGHLAACHGASQATKKILVNGVGFLPFGSTYVLASDVATPAIPLTLAKFSRGQELEADFLGLQYLYKSGYDPDALVQLLEKAGEAEANASVKSSVGQKPFDTHPQIEARIAKARKEIRDFLPQRNYTVAANPQFDNLKNRLLNTASKVQVFPKQGVTALKLSAEAEWNGVGGSAMAEPDFEPSSDVQGERAIEFTAPVLEHDGQTKTAPDK